jgi:ABC-type nickel/cobalt efflux system permease component RcnA
MASAEQLLHEAQYAFQCISYGESRDNRRNASRARKLSRKIIRRFPESTEAAEALAILRRLGDEAYTSQLARQHRHESQATHHRAADPAPQPRLAFTNDTEVERLNWGGLISLLFALPKFVLALVILAGLFLWGVFGPLLLVPLFAFVLLTGPFRRMLNTGQREQLNSVVARINDHLASYDFS